MLLWFDNTFPNEFQTLTNVLFSKRFIYFHSDDLVTIGIVQEMVQKLNQLNETVQQQAQVNDEQAKVIDELRGISLYVRSRSIFQRERERERHREKETDRQTHKQIDRKTDRKIQISWETYKQIHR